MGTCHRGYATAVAVTTPVARGRSSPRHCRRTLRAPPAVCADKRHLHRCLHSLQSSGLRDRAAVPSIAAGCRDMVDGDLDHVHRRTKLLYPRRRCRIGCSVEGRRQTAKLRSSVVQHRRTAGLGRSIKGPSISGWMLALPASGPLLVLNLAGRTPFMVLFTPGTKEITRLSIWSTTERMETAFPVDGRLSRLTAIGMPSFKDALHRP
jgi:hypothetical protein